VQCDEIWSFDYDKDKNLTMEQIQAGAGSAWTWTAIDADTKLIVSYNFCRVHKTLRVTPAMEAGLTDHVWTLEELCALLPEKKVNARIDKELVSKALNQTA
jgi:hypothetical protein